MERRDFLQTLGALVCLSADGVRGPDWPVLVQPQLLMLLGPEAVRELGMEYRALVPQEDNRDLLRSTLPGPWHRSIAATIQQDFEAGRTVVLRGWILSVTEARQCALFSML
jgi:hypothetical protein